MAKGETARARTSSAIIDSAATILAERGDAASMDDIAAAAGIGRATLYRYFASRDELLNAMGAASVQELAARIEQAHLDAVPVDEGIARLVRAILATGHKYVAMNADSARYSAAYPDFDTRVTEPMRALFRRGIAEGSLRSDLPFELQIDLLSGLVKAALDGTTSGRSGVEETAAAVASVFLEGAGATR
ncbi:TetR/AcrR family transcriptional regulator [Humibacter ginsenosidimutans]|uniref:TetR/AcrR family transcriptional regulator n=1 Tax=Humibacter ginsenosidimutans TaxID=2599293 RepID=A0A5B8M749_9MICO|nr:TetR/AcrR family transcriptional regulator [Humibacter ginsenosidimutans]QDZ15495.1 TetR/AcrR family transcriptional regulator [Humibacter ginsenosidimutans]